MCDCIKKVDEKLAERNTRLTQAIVCGNHSAPTIMLQTEIMEKKRGARATTVLLSYCPFCGEKYPEGGEA